MSETLGWRETGEKMHLLQSGPEPVASMDTTHFDSCRFAESAISKSGNWYVLNQQWFWFMQMLNKRWWGSVSEEHIESFLSRPEVDDWAIVLAENFYGAAPGIVCSGMLKFNNIIFRLDFDLDRVYHRENRHLHLDTLVIVNTPVACLMPRPQDIPDGPKRFFGACVVEQMRDMIQLLKGAWWGLTHGLNTLKCKGQIEDLQRMKEGYYCNPAAAICYMDDESCGHLFKILTSDLQIYHVTFCGTGFKLETDNGESKQFSTLRSLLDHMTTVKRVTFVSRPPPRLKQLCRRAIDVNWETVNDLPQTLLDFLGVNPSDCDLRP